VNPMAFSQNGISDVRVVANGPDLFVAWSSSVPAGTTFQIYVDRRLTWYGRSQHCHVPIPAQGIGRNIWVEVGTVGPNESTTDYSSELIAPGARTERARLSWSGGTYLDPSGHDDIQAFQIFQSSVAGASVNMAVAIDSVTAYPGGWVNDGFGKGGFGEGSFGRAATIYNWQSGPLGSGVWQFAVVPVDKAGNLQGVGQVASVTISAAPRPPALDASGTRITAAYSKLSRPQLTLNWLPSPLE